MRQSANLVFYLEALLGIYQAVGEDLDKRQRENSRHSCFTGFARAVLVIKTWYECKVIAEDSQGMGEVGMLGNDMPEMVGGWPSDDPYWLDFMGDWSLQP